jgi:hypothetical protein
MNRLLQVLSRNNDINGTPYRLVLVYSSDTGGVIEAYEARSSSPNIVGHLQGSCTRLMGFHLAPSDYNETRRAVKAVLKHED